NKRAARAVRTVRLAFVNEFFQLAQVVVVCCNQLVFGSRQGVVSVPTAIFGSSGLANTSLTGRPGKCRKPLSHRTGIGLLSSRKFPVSASTVGTKLRLSYGSSTTKARGIEVLSPPDNMKVEWVEMRKKEP